VPPEQVLPLRQALERLLGDPELRKTLGSAARKHCEEAFSYERMLERMEQLYRSVAGVPPRLAG